MSAPRLAPQDKPRLHAQVLRLQRFYLSNPGRFFTLAELVRGIGAVSEAGVSARLRDLRKQQWTVSKRKRARSLWEYSCTPPGISAQLELV